MEGKEMAQLMVPTTFCEVLLWVVHTTPMGGHLGRDKPVGAPGRTPESGTF